MPRELSLHWFPLLPVGSLALVAGVLLLLLLQGCRMLHRKGIPTRWIAILGALRMLAVVLLVLALCAPTVSYLSSVTRPADLLILVDTSQSMGQIQPSPARSRLEETVGGLRQSGLYEAIGDRFQARWFGFDSQAYPIEPSQLTSIVARGSSTNYARGLTTALDLLREGTNEVSPAARVERVLLVSDGHDHGAEDLADTALRLGISVDTLAAPSERRPTQNAVTLSRVQATPRVLLGSETQFRVTLAYDRQVARDLALQLFEDDRPVQTYDVALDPERQETQVKIAWRPTTPGLHRYELGLVQPHQAAGGESPERYGVNVQVADDRIELLVLEDRWRWEFKYLRRVLEDDPSFNFSAMISRGDNAFVQFGEPDRRVNLGGFPRSRSELDWFDVLVLGDVRPLRWPKGFASAVADAVVEGGKSLILIAGPNLDELAQIPELHTLLPVELTYDSAVPLEGPLAVQATPEGTQSPFFAGVAGELPAVDRIYAPLRKRAGAVTLVEATEQANAAGRLIVMAEHSAGRGRVLYIGTDSLWTWQSLTAPDEHGVTLYSKFWQQTLRALTPSKRAGQGGLWLSTDRSRYEVGNRVTLRAERAEGHAENAAVQATITLPDGRRLPLAVVADSRTAGVFESQFDATLPGRYRISVSALVDGQQVAETWTAIEAVAAGAELTENDVDHAAMARIASRTGGRVIDLSDKGTWPTADEQPTQTIDQRHTVDLWGNLSLLVLLCLVLGVDWLLRLIRGFV